MSLTTYSGLKTGLANLLNRTDLTNYIPDFITMCEAEMNRRLDTRQMEETTTLTIDGASEALPTGFGGVKAFQLTENNGTRMEYVSPAGFDTLNTVTGNPVYWTVSGDNFYFAAPPGGSFTARLRYRKLITALSDDNTSNWVLAAHPDMYLYGSAIHSAPFLKDDARIQLWQGKFDQLVEQVNMDGQKQRRGTPIQTRSMINGNLNYGPGSRWQ